MSRIRKLFQPAPIKTCGGKNCYKTEREAREVAEEQELRDITGELELKVYRCINCGLWHLSRVKIKS